MSRNSITNEMNSRETISSQDAIVSFYRKWKPQMLTPSAFYRNFFDNTKFHVLQGKLQETWGNGAFFQYHGKFLEIWSFIRWQWFFGLCFVRVSSIYRGQSRKRWWRAREKEGRRQLTMILHMPHSFWFTLFFCRHCKITTYFFSLSEISSRGVWLHFRQIDSFNNGDKTEVEKNAKTLLKFWTFSLHGSFLRKRNILITSKE